MDVSDEAIVLFYLLNDGDKLDDVSEKDTVKISMLHQPFPNFVRFSSTLTNKNGRTMYTTSSKLAKGDGMVGVLQEYIKVPIPVTPELLEEARFYAKFVDLS